MAETDRLQELLRRRIDARKEPSLPGLEATPQPIRPPGNAGSEAAKKAAAAISAEWHNANTFGYGRD